jgi:hypothetical protein
MQSDIQRFLNKFLLFFVVVVLLISGLFKLSDFVIKQRMEQLLKINDQIRIVFSGDSNIECSINDSLIIGSINIAQSGEAYLYSYAKLRALLNYNSQIDSVFIGFSYHEILKDKEALVLFDNSFIIEKIKLFNYLLNKSEKKLIITNKPLAYLKGFLQSIFNNFIVFIKSYTLKGSNDRILNFGGYSYLARNKLEEDIRLQAAIKKDPTTGTKAEKGLIQEKYLKLISQLCQQKSVKLILLNTPKHNYYSNIINKEIKDNWLSFRKSLSQDSLLDLSSFHLPDSCFSDITHLNYVGARIFSNYLNEQIHLKSDTLLRIRNLE